MKKKCSGRMWIGLFGAVVFTLSAGTAGGRTNTPFLLLYPAAWENALTNYSAFKTRLGFRIYTNTLEHVTGGDTDSYEKVRGYLSDFRTTVVPDEPEVYVLLVGNWATIPAPSYRIEPSDPLSRSDIYYRDLHTDFNSDGDDVFAEYGSGVTNDFNSTTLDAVFSGISNDLIVGRVPVSGAWGAASVEAVFDRIVQFEREDSPRKGHAIMSAGRIDTSMFAADSWDYALKGIVTNVINSYPEKSLVTVVHAASNYTGGAGIDYLVEGDNISADYTRGQDIIRGLWQSNNACAFLCNVSHGGSYYDFAIRRNGAGFPGNVNSAIILSMSCSSYDLGKAALTNGIAATYLGSSAVVTPDVETILTGQPMVSATVQKNATLKIFCENLTVGKAFAEEFNYYVQQIPVTGWMTYQNNRAGILRNVIGFQIIGDPTLTHALADTDADGLLDQEEETLGLLVDNPDTDGDGLPDGYEFYQDGVDPHIYNGLDVDGDNVSNADEITAGTCPLLGTAYPRIDALTNNSGIVFLACPSATGRTYRIQTCDTLSAAWQTTTVSRIGTGELIILSYTNSPAAQCHYRIAITRP
ncbi:MAG: hypothetical protein EOM20_02780 [Spartobacteria bacterium]|nr:hypothetical protein [Spartobacteria bacterium]